MNATVIPSRECIHASFLLLTLEKVFGNLRRSNDLVTDQLRAHTGELLLTMEVYSKQMDSLYRKIIRDPSPSSKVVLGLWENYVIQTRNCLGMYNNRIF